MFRTMKAYGHYRDIPACERDGRVVTIGNFDGIHRGHQAVLAAARERATDQNLELAVLTFEPHPVEALSPERVKLRLVEPMRKLELLADHGPDLTLAQQFDETFASLTAHDFAREVLAEGLSAQYVTVGANFRFGRGREGDIGILEELGDTLGFAVSSAPLVREGDAEISSSRIRRALVEGDVSEAGALLGRCHQVVGTVAHDRGLGGEIGFPTINLLDVETLVPAPGIYAGRALIEDALRPAAIYIGDRPTTGAGQSLEAHLLDFDGDLYGRRVPLDFIARLRGDRRFDDIDALRAQIDRDVEQIRSMFEVLDAR